MKYKVIDNFLDEEYFNELVSLLTDKEYANNIMPWFLQTAITTTPEHRPVTEDKIFILYHMFYNNHRPQSPLYEKLIPLLEKLKVSCLIRIKGNFYPNTHILHEHPMHKDYPYSHSTALLSLNTCDGYTKLKDGTKIDSVANRILLFDASKGHCSTTTTNVFARFNININYIQGQFKENEWVDDNHWSKQI